MKKDPSFKILSGRQAIENIAFEIYFAGALHPALIVSPAIPRKKLKIIDRMNLNNPAPAQKLEFFEELTEEHDFIIVAGGQPILNRAAKLNKPVYFIPVCEAGEIYDLPENVRAVITDDRLFKQEEVRRFIDIYSRPAKI